MSGLKSALAYKKERAQEVVDFVYSLLKTLEKSNNKDELVLKRKSSRMIHALKDRTSKTETDFEFLSVFNDYIEKVIAKFVEFGDPAVLIEKRDWVNEIKPIVIFDVDDTLRDASHRYWVREEIEVLKQKMNQEEDYGVQQSIREEIDEKWQVFFIEGFKDKPKQDMIDLCNMYYDMGFEVRIRTGASALYYDRTVEHLKELGVKYHDLRMRKIGVRIPDYRLKPAWIPKYDLATNVFATYDDRQPLNDGFQKKGVKHTYLVDKEFNVKEHIEEIKASMEKQQQFF
jgi:hypothetical protein